MIDQDIQNLAFEIITKEAAVLPNLFKAVSGLLRKTPTVTTATASKVVPSTLGKTFKEFGSRWSSTEKITPLTAGEQLLAPKQKRFFGIGKEVSPEAVIKTTNPTEYVPAKGFLGTLDPRKAVGQAATNLGKLTEDIETHGGIKGVGTYLKRQWKEHQYFTRDGHKYKRSPIGRITSPLWGSGAGMAAVGALTAEGKDGQPPTIGRRLKSGLIEGAGWGIAPHAMGLYYAGRTGYELMK
jgi:hypothetical protein